MGASARGLEPRLTSTRTTESAGTARVSGFGSSPLRLGVCTEVQPLAPHIS